MTLPESVARLRVVMRDSKLAYDPMLVIMRNALETEGRATVVEDVGIPTLVLFHEHTEVRVLSVDSNGRASGYTVKYEVGFRLLDVDGQGMLEPQTLRLIREYTFDPLNLLAKEREELELKRLMQIDAARQIVQRISKMVATRADALAVPDP